MQAAAAAAGPQLEALGGAADADTVPLVDPKKTPARGSNAKASAGVSLDDLWCPVTLVAGSAADGTAASVVAELGRIAVA